MSYSADDDDGSAPYADQTATNTGSQQWLSGYSTIKADFATLAQYAMNMLNAAMDLQPASMSLFQIPQLSTEAFGGGEYPFPEATLASLFLSTNFKDLVSMLTDLHVGLQNTAYAAQTISDAYHLNDVSSAAELNKLISVDGVDFAFGMGGDRPAGLDKRIGKTWLESNPTFDEAQANAGALSSAADPSQFGGAQTVSYVAGPAGTTIKLTTIKYPDGSSIQITESSGAPGVKFTDYSIIGADGKTTSSSRQTTTVAGGTTTVASQQIDKNGVVHDAGTQVTKTSTRSDGAKITTTTTTTLQGGKQVPTSTETKTVDQNGATTTSTVTHNSDGPDTTNTVAVGSNNSDTSDQQGSNDPKSVADKRYTTFTRPTMK